jgi:hypothetical protein
MPCVENQVDALKSLSRVDEMCVSEIRPIRMNTPRAMPRATRPGGPET